MSLIIVVCPNRSTHRSSLHLECVCVSFFALCCFAPFSNLLFLRGRYLLILVFHSHWVSINSRCVWQSFACCNSLTTSCDMHYFELIGVSKIESNSDEFRLPKTMHLFLWNVVEREQRCMHACGLPKTELAICSTVSPQFIHNFIQKFNKFSDLWTFTALNHDNNTIY